MKVTFVDIDNTRGEDKVVNDVLRKAREMKAELITVYTHARVTDPSSIMGYGSMLWTCMCEFENGTIFTLGCVSRTPTAETEFHS